MRKLVRRLSTKVSKLSNEQVERLFNSLTNENETFDAVIESLSVGLIVCDKNWRLIFTNRVAERFIPLSHYTFERLAIWELVENEEIANFLRTAQSRQKNITSNDFTVTATTGTEHILVLTTMPLVKEKKLIGTIIKIDDVKEKREQEILLRRMESLASLTNLAANVAHEIKNPLASISIHIQLIQKALQKARDDNELPTEKYAERYLSVVNEEIERLNQIVVDFLFAVRPLNANLELLNPNELILGIVDFFTLELLQQNIHFEVKLLEKSPLLMLDAKLFKQVLINLFQNARAAIENKEGIIWISSQIKNDRYIFNVADNGKGMDKKILSRVFEPYFTTKTTGNGLGLTMVYKIIKEFSGEITVNSYPDEGTVFTISLPIPQKELLLLE
ncbi:MAG: two-component system sensor histidine kinase NtrB [Treponemataceae bacterium]